MQPCKNGNVSIKAEGLSHPIAPRSQGVGAIRNPVPVQVSQHILTHITVGSQPLWLHAHCRTHTLLHRPSFSFPQEQKPVPSCPKHSRGSCARTGAQGKQPFCVAVPLPTPPAPGMLSERRKTHSKRLPKYQSALQSPREERFSSPAEAAVNKHGTCFIACQGCPLPSAELTPAQGRSPSHAEPGHLLPAPASCRATEDGRDVLSCTLQWKTELTQRKDVLG